MKIVKITILILFIVMFLFGTVKINGVPINNIFAKALGTAVYAVILGLIIGIPLNWIINIVV